MDDETKGGYGVLFCKSAARPFFCNLKRPLTLLFEIQTELLPGVISVLNYLRVESFLGKESNMFGLHKRDWTWVVLLRSCVSGLDRDCDRCIYFGLFVKGGYQALKFNFVVLPFAAFSEGPSGTQRSQPIHCSGDVSCQVRVLTANTEADTHHLTALEEAKILRLFSLEGY